MSNRASFIKISNTEIQIKKYKNITRDIEKLLEGALNIEQTPQNTFIETEYQNIQNKNGIMTVSSRQVAEHFDRDHKHALEGIETLIKGVAEKSVDLFIESRYQHEQNKQWYKEYLLTRDGFILTVMGFTGTKALEWKLKYIAVFNKMEKSVKQIPQRSSFGDLAALMKEWRQWAKSMNMPPYMAMKELIKFLQDKGEPVHNTWA